MAYRELSADDLEEGRVWLRILGVGLVLVGGAALFLLPLFSPSGIISEFLLIVGVVFVLASKKDRSRRRIMSGGKATNLVVSEIKCKAVSLNCPHCGASQDGWMSDPRGCEEKCDECGKPYSVAIDSQINFD